jgi:radical SAM superfamily enzyme YgiQ (UPF0313 family)
MKLPELEQLTEHVFEIGSIRPPSEGGSHSLLIRATRNCPWNLCKFCYGTPYNRGKFQLRTVEEVKKDIDTAKIISGLIETTAERLGGMDWAARVIDPYFLYKKGFSNLDKKEIMNFQCVMNVFRWLLSGRKSAFLQDANSLIMPTPSLIAVVTHLKRIFPSLERITSYARAKTIAQRSRTVEKLTRLHESGLSRLHVGLETGDDELLKYINKGVTSDEHVLAGRKAKKAGFELSEYWMPGLGGQTMSEQHARNTATVLNAINPEFVRSRKFVPREGTPLCEEWKKGQFQLLSPHEELREIQMMIENLDITGRVCFDHFINPAYKVDAQRVWLFKQDYNGYKLPEEKPKILHRIKYGLEINESFFIRAEDLVKKSL